MMNKIRKGRVMGGARVALFSPALIGCNGQNPAAKNIKGTVESFLYLQHGNAPRQNHRQTTHNRKATSNQEEK